MELLNANGTPWLAVYGPKLLNGVKLSASRFHIETIQIRYCHNANFNEDFCFSENR